MYALPGESGVFGKSLAIAIIQLLNSVVFTCMNCWLNRLPRGSGVRHYFCGGIILTSPSQIPLVFGFQVPI